MKKISTLKHILYISILFIPFISSCKKDKKGTTNSTTQGTPVSLGLFEYSDGTNYRVFIPLTQIGTSTVNYDEVFDTGSAGLTFDARGTIPASLIDSVKGFQIAAGDSVVVNGITITSTKGEMEYGNTINGTDVYGNVAYTNITVGFSPHQVTIKRVPFFLYYKVVNMTNGVSQNDTVRHDVDIFGVSPEYSYASTLIQSPLSYYSPGSGLSNGFKLSTLIKADFTNAGVYEQSVLTLGLTQADLTSSNFIMHPLTYSSIDGYSPDIPGTVTYGGNTISATFLFDTGTPELTIIEDKTANSIGQLPANSTVTIKTTKGFTYTYTTTNSSNLTEVENPNKTGDIRTILSLEFFIDNEFLTDYSGHQIGLKNN